MWGDIDIAQLASKYASVGIVRRGAGNMLEGPEVYIMPVLRRWCRCWDKRTAMASGTVSTREGQDRLHRRYPPIPVAHDES
jgi:hypothetical protein